MLHNEARKLLIQALEKTHNATEVAESLSANHDAVYCLKKQSNETGSIETRTHLRRSKPALSKENIRSTELLYSTSVADKACMKQFAKQPSNLDNPIERMWSILNAFKRQKFVCWRSCRMLFVLLSKRFPHIAVLVVFAFVTILANLLDCYSKPSIR